MNVKRWLLASVVALVFISVFGYVVHEVLLADLYKQTASAWRPEADMDRMMWMMSLGGAIFALAFTWIYAKGYEASKAGLGQGLRFGVYIWVLTSVAFNLSWYVILPIPAVLPVYWTISGLIESLGMGAIVGLLYKP
ncbi:MAG TPA: hypothetical protein VJS66_09025 [Burkholderiales bacterium]|nr:hypothetical protein [Burkholderiales bacterium]